MAAPELQPRAHVALVDGVTPQGNGVASPAASTAAATLSAAPGPAPAPTAAVVAPAPSPGPGGGSGSHGVVTKVLSKRDSVREVKKDKDKDEKPSKKSHKDKKESSVGLASSEPRHSTASGCSDGAAKEVKFREPEGSEDSGSAGSGVPGSPKVPHKFISNWRHACDKTRDRTRDLLKRWRTAPEGMDASGVLAESGAGTPSSAEGASDGKQSHGWSVHVWATWVKRLPSEEEGFLSQDTVSSAALLTPVQRNKLSQFFTYLLDPDHDDLVSKQDFENFSERLRHFADWSDNSSEYHILRELEYSFVCTFLEQGGPCGSPLVPAGPAGERLCSLEHWLSQWGTILDKAKTFSELPVWLQFFPKVMFQVINKSGTGVVSRDELAAFYSSVLGLGPQRVGEVLDPAYKALTANGDYPLCFPAYRWCYANFLLGRNRNGPGQYLFGPGEIPDLGDCPFPVDYSALNSAPEELEQYSPDRKSNRRSVVV